MDQEKQNDSILWSSQAANSDLPPGSFLIRHWHGKQGLAQSFWITGVALTAAWFGLLIAALYWLFQRPMTRAAAVVAAAVLIISTVSLFGWQWVGVWRSAHKHRLRGGGTAAASAVLVAMCLLGAGGSFALFRFSARLNETAQRTANATPIPKMRILASSRQNALLVCGGIEVGAAKTIAALLDKDNGFKAIGFSSPGGSGIEGDLLHDMIRDRQLDTFVIDTCASACTSAFLGGKERLISMSGRLGFHASSASLTDEPVAALEKAAGKAKLLGYGVPEPFVDRVLATPFSKIWIPEPGELKKAGVVTSVAFNVELTTRYGRISCQ